MHRDQLGVKLRQTVTRATNAFISQIQLPEGLMRRSRRDKRVVPPCAQHYREVRHPRYRHLQLQQDQVYNRRY
jgi:hypothetical protein